MAAFEPYAGARSGAAWDAGAAILRDGQWVNRDAVVDAMYAASDMQRSSCEQLVTSAIKAGWLRRGQALSVRVTEAGQALRKELRQETGG